MSLLRYSESGFAMLTALILILIMAMLTGAVVNLALSEYSAAASHEQSVQAFFVAEAALERALAVLRLDDDWSDAPTSWQPLNDPDAGGPAVDVPFPSGSSARRYSIYVRQGWPGGPPPAGPCPGSTADPNNPEYWVNNTLVRAIGRFGRAARTVEFLAHRLTAGDMTTYSAQDVILNDPSAKGAGNVEIHGSLYVRGGLGLKAVKTGIYNDRPLFSGETDPPGYCNQLFVRGILDMTKANATVGTASQPMWGVHAWEIKLKKGVKDPLDVIHTKYLGNEVPDIPYPDVEGYVQMLKTTGGYGNALETDGRLIMCRKSSPAAAVDPAPVLSSDLVLGGSSEVFYLPSKAYWDSLSVKTCAPDVESGANFILKWDSSFSPGKLAFNSANKDKPVLVSGMLKVMKDVIYSGIGTIVVDYPDQTQWAMDSGDSSGKNPSGTSPLAGPCPSSLSCKIVATQPASQGYVCPTQSTMPCQDLAVFIINGNVRLNGSGTVANQENDAIIVAGNRDDPVHQFISLKKVVLYGIVIANKLDTSQNPDFRQVPDIANYMPFPFAYLLGGSGGAVVNRNWRELY